MKESLPGNFICFIVKWQCGNDGCCHSDKHNASRSLILSTISYESQMRRGVFFAVDTCCCALWRTHWWKYAPSSGHSLNKASIFMTSGEEIFLMSALCGLPSSAFDLFLESTVMIVANFEIWKHTCLVVELLCSVLNGTFKPLFAAVYK